MILVQLRLAQLAIDQRCQARADFREDWAEEMADYLRAGGRLPPVVAYRESPRCYWLADGFHRHRSHQLAGRKTIEVDVRDGTLRDAILHAVGANRDHGLKRSIPDKRKAVLILLTDPEWGDARMWSNRRVADAAGVSEFLVRTLREQMEALEQGRLEAPAVAFESQGSPEPDVVVEALTDYRRPRQQPFRAMPAAQQRQAIEGETERWRPTWRRELREGLEQAQRAAVSLGDEAADALPHVRAALAALP